MKVTIKFKNRQLEIVEYANILLVIVVLLSSIGLYHLLKIIIEYTILLFTPTKEEAQVSFLQLIATIVAGSWALILYNKKIRTDKNKFLKIFLETKSENEFVTISTKLCNETDNVRKMEMAFLIITKAPNPQTEQSQHYIIENQDQIEGKELLIEDIHYYLKQINNHLSTSFVSSEHLKALKKFNSFHSENKDLFFIQLPYYTAENIQISNEELTFDYTFLQNELKNGIYDVRFFVYPTDDEFPNLERVVHKSLIIKNEKNENNS